MNINVCSSYEDCGRGPRMRCVRVRCEGFTISLPLCCLQVQRAAEDNGGGVPSAHRPAMAGCSLSPRCCYLLYGYSIKCFNQTTQRMYYYVSMLKRDTPPPVVYKDDHIQTLPYWGPTGGAIFMLRN